MSEDSAARIISGTKSSGCIHTCSDWGCSCGGSAERAVELALTSTCIQCGASLSSRVTDFSANCSSVMYFFISIVQSHIDSFLIFFHNDRVLSRGYRGWVKVPCLEEMSGTCCWPWAHSCAVRSPDVILGSSKNSTDPPMLQTVGNGYECIHQSSTFR